MTTYYASKYKVVNGWKDTKNTYAPAGTIYTIDAINNDYFEMKPVSKSISDETQQMLIVSAKMLELGFTASEFVKD